MSSREFNFRDLKFRLKILEKLIKQEVIFYNWVLFLFLAYANIPFTERFEKKFGNLGLERNFFRFLCRINSF